MWNKESEAPARPTSATQWQPPQSTPAAPVTVRSTSNQPTRSGSCLGAMLEIKGKISGEEDLQIDGKVEGPISLHGQRLTVGRTGQLNSEVSAREVAVHGKVTGNLRVRDRVEIKKDGEVVGDITTTRISIEDGAYFKGRIEIERLKPPVEPAPETEGAPVGVIAN